MRNSDQVTLPLEATIEAVEAGEVTQKELAERSGVSGQAVHNLIKRKVGRTYENAVKVFEALQAIRAERAANNQNTGENK